MKKIISTILVLLFSQNAYALTQKEAIDKYLKGRTLDHVEGIWMFPSGSIGVIYKENNKFTWKTIYSATGNSSSGDLHGSLVKGNSVYYYGEGSFYFKNKNGGNYTKPCKASLIIEDFVKANYYCNRKGLKPYQASLLKIWPENLNQSKGSNKATSGGRTSSGTGFFINTYGNIVTNHHVIKDCNDNIKIKFKNNDLKSKQVAIDKNLDLALLKVNYKNKTYLQISDKKPEKLDRIVVAGYPFGKHLSDDLKFTSGIISALKGYDDNSTLLQIDAALNPGNSGGPIIDENTGDLVGVAVSTIRKDISENINFGIKSSALKNFLDSNNIEQSSYLSFFRKKTNVSELLENSTVYIYCN